MCRLLAAHYLADNVTLYALTMPVKCTPAQPVLLYWLWTQVIPLKTMAMARQYVVPDWSAQPGLFFYVSPFKVDKQPPNKGKYPGLGKLPGDDELEQQSDEGEASDEEMLDSQQAL